MSEHGEFRRSVLTRSSAVFQAGGMIVVVVEVSRKSYLASIVPVIVNSILNEHQLVADIVAFVAKGDFPRSRLGEKQRGKVLASWVTRRLRTVAQFSIRDPDGAESSITAVPEEGVPSPPSIHENSAGVQLAGVQAGIPTLPAVEPEPVAHEDVLQEPNYVVEQNLQYEFSIMESPLAHEVPSKIGRDGNKDDHTPTAATAEYSHGAAARDDINVQSGADYFAHPPSSRDPDQTPVPAMYQTQNARNHSGPRTQPQGHGFNHDFHSSGMFQGTATGLGTSEDEVIETNARSFVAQPDPGAAEHGVGQRSTAGYHRAPGSSSSMKPGMDELPKPQYTAYNPAFADRNSANEDQEEEWPQEAMLAMRKRE